MPDDTVPTSPTSGPSAGPAPDIDVSRVHPTVAAFKRLVEADDVDGALALLADEPTFTSPVVFRPYRGRAMAELLLTAAGQVFAGTLRYERVLADDRGAALVFRARVGDREVHGTDFLTLDGEGRIEHVMVMLRPLSALHAMAEAMQARIEALTAADDADGA